MTSSENKDIAKKNMIFQINTTARFQRVSFYSEDHFIFVVEQETEVPPLQMPLQMPRSYKSLFQSRQYVHHILIQRWKKVLI